MSSGVPKTPEQKIMEKVDQKVIIKLVNYPFEEFGSLSGNIEEIEPTPTGS